MEEQAENAETYISRLGETTRYKLEFVNEIKAWLLTLPKELKGIKPNCFFCYDKFYRGQKIYFCEKEKKFMHFECLMTKHKPILTLAKSEHEDKNVEITIKE